MHQRYLTPLLILSIFAACGTTSPEVIGVPGLEGGPELLISTGNGNSPPALLFSLREKSRIVPVMRLRGIDLALLRGGKRTDLHLPFVEIENRNHTLLLRVAPTHGHEIEVTVTPQTDGEMLIELRDQIGLRSALLELSLAYEFLVPSPIEESSIPHLLPGPDALAGDLSFQSPIAFLRSGPYAIALSPTLSSLRSERRIPQGLDLDREPARIRHGLIAQRVVAHEDESGPTFFTRDGATPVQVRAESLNLSHRLRISGNASHGMSLAEATSRLWERAQSPHPSLPMTPSRPVTWQDLCPQTLDTAVNAYWRSIDFGEVRAGTLSESTTMIEARLGALQQELRTAFAMASMAAREGRKDLTARARGVLDLVLTAPRRAGLIPARFSATIATAHFSWHRGTNQHWTKVGHHALDSAVSGYWLLQLSDYIKDRKPAVMAACRKLAYFFLLNQHRDGSIPIWYGGEYLEPLEDPECGADTAGPAMFLAEYAQRSGDPRIQEAARIAVAHLGKDPLQTSYWPTPIRMPGKTPAPIDVRTGNYPRHPFLLTMAARASLILASSTKDARDRDLSDRMLSALCFHQQVWIPDWLPAHQRGGISAGNQEILWGTPIQSLVAETFLHGYELSGRREWLERGAAALSAGIAADTGGWTPRGATPATLHWGKSTAIAMVEQARGPNGQGIVDVAGNFAQGLDALWFEEVAVVDEQISFRLLSHAAFTRPARIVFRNLPAEHASFLVSVNGDLQGEFTRNQLADGLPLLPRMVANITFKPPSQISTDSEWTPRARYTGPLGKNAKVEIEIATARGVLKTLRLSPRGNGILVADEPFQGSDLDQHRGLRVRLHHLDDNRRSSVPSTGYHIINVASMNCLDLGDDLEFALVGDAGSKLERFADGRENGRAIKGSEHFTYAVPVGSHSTTVNLQMRLTGSVRIKTDDHLLHEDEEFFQDIHEIKIELSDPRLWRDGHLLLNFSVAKGVGGEVNMAHILYRSEGDTAAVSNLGQGVSFRSPDSKLRILVLPISLADAPMRVNRQSIHQAFFSSSDYRLTPDAEPRMTAGSVSNLLSKMSGGISELRGETLDIIRSKLSDADLTGDAIGAVNKIAEIARAHLAKRDDHDLDAVVIVHSGTLPPTNRSLPNIAGSTSLPCVILPEHSRDGSMISTGVALLNLLDSIYHLHDLATPRFGNFGQLALSADGHGHIPSGLTGANLVRTGWADQITIRPPTDTTHSKQTHLLSLSSIQEGRVLYRIPFDQLPGRGDLCLESRARSHAEPGFPGSGCLLYWDFDDRHPLVRSRDASAQSRYLRLSPVTPTPSTPFSPGTERDLFVSAANLDGTSVPSLATIQGETLWAIHDLQSSESGHTNLELAYLGHDLLIHGESKWYSMRFQRTRPLPLDGQNQGLGSVTERDGGYSLQMRPTRGAGIRGRFLIATSDAPMRLFLRINKQGPGTGEFHLEIDGAEKIVAPVKAGKDQFLAQVDLVPHQATSFLQIDALSRGGEWTAELDRLLLVPKTLATQQVRLPGRARQNVLLMDGVHYAETHALTASILGTDKVVVPIILPAGKSALRFSLGFRDDASPSTQAALSAHLRSEDATWEASLLDDFAVNRGTGIAPLHLGIIEIAGPEKEQVAFLTINLKSPKGTTVHFVNLSIDRH